MKFFKKYTTDKIQEVSWRLAKFVSDVEWVTKILENRVTSFDDRKSTSWSLEKNDEVWDLNWLAINDVYSSFFYYRKFYRDLFIFWIWKYIYIYISVYYSYCDLIINFNAHSICNIVNFKGKIKMFNQLIVLKIFSANTLLFYRSHYCVT